MHATILMLLLVAIVENDICVGVCAKRLDCVPESGVRHAEPDKDVERSVIAGR